MSKENKKDRKRGGIEFDLEVVNPKEFTKENIAKMTDILAKQIAIEASHALEVGVPEQGFHIRLGGGHSRTFSKTSDHKNVIHSRSGGGGSTDIPFI